ncbi:MAG: fucose isomerase [Anaerolinea sp.]|nr:fucose isomerase [Anaerolinea sp.]
MTTPFAFLPVASSLVPGTDGIRTIIHDYLEPLAAIGGMWQPAERLDTPLPLCYFVVTGGTENAILGHYATRRQSIPGEPVLLLAHPTHNSLPAALETLARLQQDGVPGRIFYLRSAEDEVGWWELATAVHNLTVWHYLQQARIGLVGDPSDWLVASMPGAATVRQAWGPTVIPVDLVDVEAAIQAVPAAAVADHVAELRASAADIREPTTAQIADAARTYIALKDVVQQQRLDALTVRCFDIVMRLKTTGCFGLAQLTDEGVIAGCEGDLVSTVGLLWAYKLLGEIPWMANPAQIDETRNTLWLAHCTVPRRIVQAYRLRSHFESGEGIGIQGSFAAGPVTLLRIGGKGMDRLWLAEGEILQAGHAENLCRTQAEVRLTHGGHVGDLLRAPLGNHTILVPGHHLDRLQRWWQTMRSPIL